MPPETEIWLDAQLSPALCSFISKQSGNHCFAVRELGLLNEDDVVIFNKAKKHSSSIIIITKDSDFVDLLIRFGSPPKIIFLTCGNTSNAMMKEILSFRLKEALNLLSSAENEIVEIAD
ncbi:MAG: DUF5615 family PIN-like protein [Bacteroidetes bacterium]|nr:DUF5615 family PIN-like protein [Bacteroidota bacterium]